MTDWSYDVSDALRSPMMGEMVVDADCTALLRYDPPIGCSSAKYPALSYLWPCPDPLGWVL